jgi:hypothetical protein
MFNKTYDQIRSARYFGIGFFLGSTLYELQISRVIGFFSFSFQQSYSNILMIPRCRLLRGLKISAVAYCAYCHSAAIACCASKRIRAVAYSAY